MKGRTIRLYLVDGAPNGVVTAEIMNWTGKVILAPRQQLSDLAGREECKRTGVYIIVGPDPDDPDRESIYIGEGDNVLKRLVEHDKDVSKDFWTRAVIVTSKDDNLTKSHGRYLESRLIDLAKLAGVAIVTNGTSPPLPPMPEPDVADMEYFLEQLRMVLPVLGMRFLQPKPTTDSGSGVPAVRFENNKVGGMARAVEIDNQFIVLKNSTARKHGVDSWDAYVKLRNQLVEDGKLIDGTDPAFYVFAEDTAFSSPSAAAAVVEARNANGRESWLVEGTKQTYAQWHDAKLASVESEAPPDD